MINLIEKFIEETEQMRVYLSLDKRNSDYQEVYFFLGKDSVLCISKQDNKVLYQIKYNQLQINISSASDFSINVNGQPLFFCQSDDITSTYEDITTEVDENVATKKDTAVSNDTPGMQNTCVSKDFKFKNYCEQCSSKKCSQYDTLNGRNFKFGKGPVSEDMLIQYDKYCETKMKKFGCIIEGNR